MPRNRMRGNDLTGHEVVEYDLEELRRGGRASPAVDEAIEAIRQFAQVIQRFHAACAQSDASENDDDEDSTAQLANEVLRKIERLRELRTGAADSDLLVFAALSIGQLHERLRWMWLHQDAARKGHRRRAHEALAQRSGAAANKGKARRNVEAVATRLKEDVSPKKLATLTDSALARRIKGSEFGGYRTVRGYVAEARNAGLLPLCPRKTRRPVCQKLATSN